MTNDEYQKIVESKFGKPLRDIMYELCVIKDVVQSEGASILEVPKSTFIAWRNKFRFGPKQRMIDRAEKLHNEEVQRLQEKYNNINIMRPFLFSGDDKSIMGFKELIERYLELWEIKKSKEDGVGDFMTIVRINELNNTLSLIDSYMKGSSHEAYMILAEEQSYIDK